MYKCLAYSSIKYFNKPIKTEKPSEKQVSFTSRPIYDVKIKQLDSYGKYILTPAVFSELIHRDTADIQAVLNIQELWKHTKYGSLYSRGFINSTGEQFYALEAKNSEKSLSDKILCAMKISLIKDPENRKKAFEVSLLQTAPQVLNNPQKNLKGCGEICIYSALKLAKKNNVDSLQVLSSNDSFYKHIGNFQVLESYGDLASLLSIPKPRFNEALEKIALKYML